MVEDCWPASSIGVNLLDAEDRMTSKHEDAGFFVAAIGDDCNRREGAV